MAGQRNQGLYGEEDLILREVKELGEVSDEGTRRHAPGSQNATHRLDDIASFLQVTVVAESQCWVPTLHGKNMSRAR